MSGDLKRAKEKASDYATEKHPATTPEDGKEQRQATEQNPNEPRELSQWESFIDHRIEEAMRAGAFDNLPGHGRPLQHDSEPFEPDEWRMANKLLKNNDLTPAWIGDRGATLARIERFRAEMEVTASHYRGLLQATDSGAHRQELQQQWSTQVAQWSSEIVELNRKILTVNLQLPTIRLELFQLRLDEELARVGMAQALDDAKPNAA